MKKILYAALALLFCAQVHAGCKTADFNGTWIMYQANLNEQHTGRCQVAVSKGQASGECAMSNGMNFAVQGPATVQKDCAVSLQLDFTGGSSSFDLQLAKNKQTFAGQWGNTFGTHGISQGVKR